MQAYVLPKSRLNELVAALKKDHRVVAPVAKENGFVFAEVDEAQAVRLDYSTSVLSPKKYFFPQYETLLKFHRGKSNAVEVPLDSRPTAILGMHPCDITSTWLLDKVFADGNKDAYYDARRERAFIVGLDCARPCDDKQFCQDMGSLYPRTGFDLFCQDLGNRFLVKVGTDRGQKFIDASRLFVKASSDDLLAHEQFDLEKGKQFTRRLPFDVAQLGQLLGESYDSLIWDAVARRCFSCGSCNLVCPTCYCFNVADEVNLDLASGQRQRRWDACQLRDFAEVAGGENFREQAAARLRHRVFRKGKYMKDQFGELGCVGCGRCDRNCVASISIRKAFEQLWETQSAKQVVASQARHAAVADKRASLYVPWTGKIVEAANFTERERWMKVRLDDGPGMTWLPGQFVEVSLLGVGEAPISICSACTDDREFEMCIRNVGDVTSQVHRMGVGDTMGIRGAFGNGFDMTQVAGQDVLFVAGGLGLAPCRSFIQAALNHRNLFGKVTILYGARNPKEMLFRSDIQAWAKRTDCDLHVTVDRPDENWLGHVGVITTLFREISLEPNRTAVFVIGPPVMFKYAVMEVLALGIPEARVFCSLERRMKCGLGKCGHCQIRDIYVCQDGPIFTYQQVKRMREGI